MAKQARKRRQNPAKPWAAADKLAKDWLEKYGAVGVTAKPIIYEHSFGIEPLYTQDSLYKRQIYGEFGIAPRPWSTCGGCQERKEMSKEDYLCQSCRT